MDGLSLLVGIVGIIIGTYFGITGHFTSKKLHEQLKLMQADNKDLERANKDLANANKDLANANTRLEDANKKLKVLYEQVQKKLPEVKKHIVLMDGISASGKSTFIARIMSPVSSKKELNNMVATVSEYRTTELPICWEDTSLVERSIVHSIQFFDIAGEKAGTVINALNKIDDSNKKLSTGIDTVLLIIWDISNENFEENSKQLNPTRLEATYGNDIAKEIIKKIVVFFNKVDTVETSILSNRIKEQKHKLDKEFKSLFGENFDEKVEYRAGSALNGQGIHDCIGAILKHFDLEPNFQKITGNNIRKVEDSKLIELLDQENV